MRLEWQIVLSKNEPDNPMLGMVFKFDCYLLQQGS